MDFSLVGSGCWLEIVAVAWSEAQRSRGEGSVTGALAAKLKTSPSVAQALVVGVRSLLEYGTSDSSGSAVDAEVQAVAAAMKAVRPILEAKLQGRLDALDGELVSQTKCPECGLIAPSQGRRERPWKSLAGELNLTRRYAWCEQCEVGRAPAQEKLGLPESPFTARFEEVCTLMATTVPHGMAVDLLDKLLGIEVSAKGIQQMVERRAEGLAAQLEADAATYAPFDDKGLSVPFPSRPPEAKDATGKVAYLELDGVVPMTREEIPAEELTTAEKRQREEADQAGARGGKGRRYQLVGREVKNAVLYSGEQCAREGPERGCILEKRYVSHLGDWGKFAALLWVELTRQGFDRAARLVVLSDGAEWVRSLCAWLPIPIFLILDLFHVKHRIWEVANLLYGEHSKQAGDWAHAQCERAEAGRADQVIQALKFLRPRRREAREKAGALAEYLTNNLDRMKYPEYRAMGLRVTSAAVESANYHVTGARLKLQGMRWSEQGARDMAYLRADLFNGNWEARTRALLAA